MSVELITMELKDLNRLLIINKVNEKQLSQKKAAEILECTDRTIRRLQKRVKKYGAQGILSKKHGKKSNKKYSNTVKDKAINLIKEQYYDFGPTLATEYLAERDKFIISKETTRKWMIEAGIWIPKQIKCNIHQPRKRRPYYGELIQIDGSPHDWFEGRGEKCTLLLFIDDATSKIQLMRFAPAETTFAYFTAMRIYIDKYGLPRALYSDKHSVFRVNRQEPVNSTGYTQFGRAMNSLGIKLIYANSPQAKGKVERKNRSLQDRLIKQMRLDGINNIEMATDEYLDQYAYKYNSKFAVPPEQKEDLHCHVDDLEQINRHLTVQHKRRISKNLTVSYHGFLYKIIEPHMTRRLYNKKIIVSQEESGQITLLYDDKPLAIELYDKNNYPSEPVSRKEVDVTLGNNAYRPPEDHPWKVEAHRAAILKQAKHDGPISDYH